MNSNFDEFIKQKLESIEEPFAEVEWEKFNKKLAANSTVAKTSAFSGKFLFLAVALILGAIATTYLVSSNQETPTVSAIQNVAENEVSTEAAATASIPETTATTESAEKKAEILVESKTDAASEPTPQPSSKKEKNTITTAKSSTAPMGQLVTQTQLAEPIKGAITQEQVLDSERQKPELKLNKSIFCTGESLAIEVVKLNKGDKVKIKLSDGTEYNTATASKNFNESGFYSVEAKIYNAKGEEYASLTNNYPIVVNPTPEVDIEKSLVQTDIYRPNYQLAAISTNSIQNVVWKVNGKTVGATNTVNFAFNKKGNYTIELSATGANGCATKQVLTHQENEDYNLLAANSFSPNNDGKNESWLPVALNDESIHYEIEIRDRSNNVVFKGTDKDRMKWDGSINGGAKASNGDVFSWVATVYYSANEVTTFNGVIIISKL